MKPTQCTVFATELGWMCAAAADATLVELTFGHPSPSAAWESLRLPLDPPSNPSKFLSKLIARLQAFANRPDDDFLDVQLDLEAFTSFQQSVVQQCRRIQIGETVSYGSLAGLAGRPGAARAVGQVMANNRFPLIVPCHRVVGSNGSLGGFSARDGLNMKRRLLQREQESRFGDSLPPAQSSTRAGRGATGPRSWKVRL